MRDGTTRKKMFFVPAVDNWDPAWADDIQSNGEGLMPMHFSNESSMSYSTLATDALWHQVDLPGACLGPCNHFALWASSAGKRNDTAVVPMWAFAQDKGIWNFFSICKGVTQMLYVVVIYIYITELALTAGRKLACLSA
jgi:hypothetical protein